MAGRPSGSMPAVHHGLCFSSGRAVLRAGLAEMAGAQHDHLPFLTVAEAGAAPVPGDGTGPRFRIARR
jgi:hypothetical protein